MSKDQPPHSCEPSATGVSVLLVIDTAALLAGESEATCCYALCTGMDSLLTRNDGQLHLNALPGEQVRVRWSPTALRGEQAVLLTLQLASDDVLTNLTLQTNPDATVRVPQMEDPATLDEQPAHDAFWQLDVAAEGSVELTLQAIVTDRDAGVVGTFDWPLSLVVA
ncbi:AidA/PixA family protein [Pandoraea pneumonica]|uniref:AidA/PixA family protein n=1 Tax=Pandoraea pneumonica TaxID=2508299 RepID=UPI003CE77A6D